jgi:glycosyltransferase involved in cell wall biosynthesis
VRILHILPWITSGGVEKRRLLLARHLDRQRYEQRIVCMEGREFLMEQIRAAGVPITVLGGTWGLQDYRTQARLRRIIREWRPDVVHTAVFEGVYHGVLAARFSKAPYTIVEEIDFPVTRRWRGHLLMRAMAFLADRCVAVSPAVGAYLHETLHIPEKQIRVIPNGVEIPEPVSETELRHTRCELGLEDGDLVIGSLGRMHDRHKRFSDIIDAFALLAEDHPRTKLLLVGGGPDEASLRERAQQKHLQSRIIFAGYQPDPRPYLDSMDIFALVSNRESFGLALVEAMFASLPVICTGVGGMRDVVAEGETGLFVSLGNVEDIAKGLEELIVDSELRERMGRSGHQRAMTLFTAERYASDVSSLYDELTRPRA